MLILVLKDSLDKYLSKERFKMRELKHPRRDEFVIDRGVLENFKKTNDVGQRNAVTTIATTKTIANAACLSTEFALVLQDARSLRGQSPASVLQW